MVLAFVAWYLLMPYTGRALGRLAASLVGFFMDGDVSTSSSAVGIAFKVWTYPDGGVTTAVTDVRLYSWGLPLGLAIVIAAAPRRAAPRAVWVLLAALAITVWGMSYDVLSQLLRDAPEVLRPLSMLKANLIAIGYQAGSLVLPGLAPCVVAIALCRRDLDARFPSGLAPRPR